MQGDPSELLEVSLIYLAILRPVRALQMAQCMKVLATKPTDLSSIQGIHMVQREN